MAARKPQIRYAWRARTSPTKTGADHPLWEVTWSLYGANGEYMCGSVSEGYRDKTDARRAVHDVISALCGPAVGRNIEAREVGPGRRPIE